MTEAVSPAATSPQVLVVGAGPTGMTAAYELARLGVRVRIVDKCAEPPTTSRAIGVQARTLELFQQRGLVQPMLAQGNKGVAGSIYGEGKRLFRLEFDHNGSRYGYMLFISQAETEQVLRDALAREGVSIERSVEFVALAQAEHSDRVTAILRHADGSLEAAQASYLIVSEGAHSIARSTLGLTFAGITREENYVLGDVHIDGDLADSDFHIFSSTHGFMGLFPMGSGHFRLIASNPLSKPSKDSAPTLEEIQAIYDQRSHIPARFHDMSWSSYFRINSRMVDRLHVGRVFFGGDSAHIHSPAGAQGMNTGIQDMLNLGWKLAAVLHGDADPKLLDTYSDDRIPVIRDVLTKTEGLTNAIGSENQVFRSIFATLAPAIVGTEAMQQNSTERMSQLSLNYRSSPLSVARPTSGSLQAGDRVPDLDVERIGGEGETHAAPSGAQSLFSLLSTERFTLLFANLRDAEATHSEVRSSLAPWKNLVQTVLIAPAPGSADAFKQAFGPGPSLTLVRPDGYAAYTGSETTVAELAKYLAQWFPRSSENVAVTGTHAAASEKEPTHA